MPTFRRYEADIEMDGSIEKKNRRYIERDREKIERRQIEMLLREREKEMDRGDRPMDR